MRVLLSLPLIVILMGAVSLAMLVPAIHAATQADWAVARSFLFSGLGFLLLSGFIGLATYPYHPSRLMRSRLVALVTAYIGLPLMMAVPFQEAVGDTSLYHAWFEMVSSFTTTGATLYDDPTRLAPSLHLWRALIGWLGGFFILVIAVSVFQPLNLGGFEILSGITGKSSDRDTRQITRVADPAERMARFSGRLFPIYAGLTMVLWLVLLIAGDTPLVAAAHAMSVLSTSGISPVGGMSGDGAGRMGEFVILLFMGIALSRRTLSPDLQSSGLTGLRRDPEFGLALVLILMIVVALFLRHFLGAFEVQEQGNLAAGLSALWGSLFSITSFLTTTGFVSDDWSASQGWSGLGTPGLILMGLALIGGGVATTAGGVKLLRVYALMLHGQRELSRLVEPNSVAGSGAMARHMRNEGAYVAWLFFMLFAVAICAVMLALSLDGLTLNETIVFAVAALSTTGPVAAVAGETALSFASLSDGALAILAAAMVVGRVETLAIVALLNPGLWRR